MRVGFSPLPNPMIASKETNRPEPAPVFAGANDRVTLRFGSTEGTNDPADAIRKANEKGIQRILANVDGNSDYYDVIQVNIGTQYQPYEDRTLVRHALLFDTYLTYSDKPEKVWKTLDDLNKLGFSTLIQGAMERECFQKENAMADTQGLGDLGRRLMESQVDLRVFTSLAKPLVEKYLATGTDSQKRNAYDVALSIALNRYNPEQAFEMQKLIRPVEATLARKGTIGNSFWKLQSIAGSGTADAVALVSEAWSQTGTSQPNETLLKAYQRLAMAKAPGVQDALRGKEDAFKAAYTAIFGKLQSQLAEESNPSLKKYTQQQLTELDYVNAGLTGTSLNDLPALPKPDTLHAYKWPYSVEYLRYAHLLPAVQTMAARGIEGADQLASVLKDGRDAFLTAELPKLFNQDLHPVPFAYGTGNHYSNPQVQKINYMLFLAREAGPELIPVLNKLMERPEAREKVWILELAHTINEIRLKHQVSTQETAVGLPSFAGFTGSIRRLIP